MSGRETGATLAVQVLSQSGVRRKWSPRAGRGMLVYAMIFYLPLFLQGVVGQTATKAGTSLAPLFLPVAVGAVMGGQLIAKVERYLSVYMAYQTDCQHCASSLATTSTGAC